MCVCCVYVYVRALCMGVCVCVNSEEQGLFPTAWINKSQ